MNIYTVLCSTVEAKLNLLTNLDLAELSPATKEILLELAHDNNPDVVCMCMAKIAKSTLVEPIEYLARMVERYFRVFGGYPCNHIPIKMPSPKESLKKIIQKKPSDQLLNLLSKTGSLQLDRCVIEIIGERKEKNAIPALLSLLEEEKSPLTQSVIESLSEIKAKEAIPYLRKLYVTLGPDSRIKHSMIFFFRGFVYENLLKLLSPEDLFAEFDSGELIQKIKIVELCCRNKSPHSEHFLSLFMNDLQIDDKTKAQMKRYVAHNQGFE